MCVPERERETEMSKRQGHIQRSEVDSGRQLESLSHPDEEGERERAREKERGRGRGRKRKRESERTRLVCNMCVRERMCVCVMDVAVQG